MSAVWEIPCSPLAAVDDLVAAGLEAETEGPEEGGVVVDDEDFGHASLSPSPRCRRLTRGSVNTKRAPPPGDVLDPDALAVGLDERLGDGEAETGPAAGVEAHEAVEHGLVVPRAARPARCR